MINSGGRVGASFEEFRFRKENIIKTLFDYSFCHDTAGQVNIWLRLNIVVFLLTLKLCSERSAAW